MENRSPSTGQACHWKIEGPSLASLCFPISVAGKKVTKGGSVCIKVSVARKINEVSLENRSPFTGRACVLQSGCPKHFVMGGCSDVAINIPIVCLCDINKGVTDRRRTEIWGTAVRYSRFCLYHFTCFMGNIRN